LRPNWATSLPAAEVISLHPALPARYEQQLAHLRDALSQGVSTGDSESADAVRDLVETVMVFRDQSRAGGGAVEITGLLNALPAERAYPNGVRGVWGKLVAEERFEPPLQGFFVLAREAPRKAMEVVTFSA
jgi:site-specific DNA recombinase